MACLAGCMNYEKIDNPANSMSPRSRIYHNHATMLHVSTLTVTWRTDKGPLICCYLGVGARE